jgi:hypothetical protein
MIDRSVIDRDFISTANVLLPTVRRVTPLPVLNTSVRVQNSLALFSALLWARMSEADKQSSVKIKKRWRNILPVFTFIYLLTSPFVRLKSILFLNSTLKNFQQGELQFFLVVGINQSQTCPLKDAR